MSLRRGSGESRSRKPRHQNSFAFQHNPKSKKTASILASVNGGLCKRCFDKIEWKKKYRKYKPLKMPSTCNRCLQRTVLAAYHTICQPCAKADKCCAWCGSKGQSLVPMHAAKSLEEMEEEIETRAREEGMHLREKQTLLREARNKVRKAKEAADAARKLEAEGGKAASTAGGGEEGEEEQDEDMADDQAEGGEDAKMAADGEEDVKMAAGEATEV